MTNQEKILINNLRLQGCTPTVIAKQLGMSPGTIRSFIHRNPTITGTKLCLQCGTPIVQNIKRREKKFCCDKCRNTWWNSHQDQITKRAFYTLTCEHCGKEFESYGNKNRRYCNRECYVASRQNR